MSSAVSRVWAAAPAAALEHFTRLLEYETDCWDVHHAIANDRQDFVLLDVRSRELYLQSHVRGAVSLPWPQISEENLKAYPDDALFVVYCAGPHCNGTEKAAIRLATLNRPVKKMIGGICGWIDEGLDLVGGEA